ncbi:MAG: HAMP domain-containing histidine kinase [Polyangiaceae bacterium]|nr:HAMP domain-containing histidine kinase [Polyangiaceae bacterium]
MAALVAITSFLHETTSAAATATEGVRLAEEAQLDLLLHQRNADPLVKRAREVDLTQHLVDARQVATTEEEAHILAEAEARVSDFVAASRADSPTEASKQEAAYVALEALIAVNTEQARDATRQAASLGRTATFVGLATGLLLVTGAALILAWLRRSAFAPVLAIEEQMGRFTQGDRSARAPEEGAAEMRSLARGFNEMAATIERQREQQLTFLAGVAHDLRNPLSALKLSNAVIAPDLPLPPEDRIRQTFTRVQRQVDRLERMVFDLLDAARVESGKLDLRFESADLRDVVHASVELFAPTTPNHQIVVDAPDEPLVVSCDPVRLEQVLNNLLSNAIKYSPKGGTVRASLRRESGFVRLSVADEGMGIGPDDIDHIFDPFRRTGASKELVSGVGLGLYVARRIVEGHGGQIVVTSTPGRGSVFTIELPAGAAQVRPAASESAGGPLLPPLESYG